MDLYICTKREFYFSKKKKRKEKKIKRGYLQPYFTLHGLKHLLFWISPHFFFFFFFGELWKGDKEDRWNSKKTTFKPHLYGVFGEGYPKM